MGSEVLLEQSELSVTAFDRCRRGGLRISRLAPDFEDGGYVTEENARHLAPLVDLRDSGRAQLMTDRDFVESEAVAMRPRNELPPESFFHLAEFTAHDLGD